MDAPAAYHPDAPSTSKEDTTPWAFPIDRIVTPLVIPRVSISAPAIRPELVGFTLSSTNHLPSALYDIHTCLGGDKIQLAIEIFLVSKQVEPFCYLRESPDVDLTYLLDKLGLCLTSIRGEHLLIHRQDTIATLREALKQRGRSHSEILGAILSTSLMQCRVTNHKAPHFLIHFLVTFDNKEIHVAETKIDVQEYTPEIRLQMIRILQQYQKVLGSVLEVRAHYYECNVRNCSEDGWNDPAMHGLPPGQLL